MGFVKDAWEGLTGQAAADAARDAAGMQQQGVSQGIRATQQASAQGQEFLAPYGGVGQQGVDQASFLTDPQAQFQYLQSNPLFKLALENANTQTGNMAAARGRLSAGDTLQQLSKNVLLSASPLIQQQKGSISDLLNFGSGIARSQANTAIGEGSDITNLITSGAAAGAAGEIGAANAQTQGFQNLLTSGILAGGIFG